MTESAEFDPTAAALMTPSNGDTGREDMLVPQGVVMGPHPGEPGADRFGRYLRYPVALPPSEQVAAFEGAVAARQRRPGLLVQSSRGALRALIGKAGGGY